MDLKLNSPKKIFSFFNTYKKYYTFINHEKQFFNHKYFQTKKEILTIFFLNSNFEFITMLHQVGNNDKINIDYRNILFYSLVISWNKDYPSNFDFSPQNNLFNQITTFANKKNSHHSQNNQKIKIIFLHNHPSDVLIPSKNDLTFTKKNQIILKIIGFQLLDHLIYHEKKFFSFSKNSIIV